MKYIVEYLQLPSGKWAKVLETTSKYKAEARLGRMLKERFHLDKVRIREENPGQKHLSGASAKAQRAYEHIKSSLHGERRKEIAARTVRKMIGEGRINPFGETGLYLWGYHRITGNWDRLQGPSDTVTLEQYQTYFAKTTLSDYYSNVKFSGFSNDSRPAYTKFSISAKKPRKSNPSEAEEISEGFHGRPISEVLEVEEEELIPEDTAVLGCLLDITVTRDDGKTGIPIIFLRDGQKPKRGEEVYVCAPDRHNIEFVGGDQEIKGIEKLCGCDHAKQFVKLGHVESLAYLADKHHLEGSNGREEPYEHEFGKKRWLGFGKKYGRPELVYDTRNFKISLVGGTYTVEDEGITN